MITTQPDVRTALENCLIEAIQTHLSKDLLQFTEPNVKNHQAIDPNQLQNWSIKLQSKQNQNTIDGIAYCIGQSFFYAYLYTFDKNFGFSELSFKLQSFEQKSAFFLSTFAQQLKISMIKCEWNAKKKVLIFQTMLKNLSIIHWFIKGMFTELLFWLSNGKQKQVQIEHFEQSNIIEFQISII